MARNSKFIASVLARESSFPFKASSVTFLTSVIMPLIIVAIFFIIKIVRIAAIATAAPISIYISIIAAFAIAVLLSAVSFPAFTFKSISSTPCLFRSKPTSFISPLTITKTSSRFPEIARLKALSYKLIYLL